ncbi:MAG: hypothetical protein [Cressdnaviricota sp.]|nr:MAG: hypothetical protein [Cressdnaviricota sp.]
MRRRLVPTTTRERERGWVVYDSGRRGYDPAWLPDNIKSHGLTQAMVSLKKEIVRAGRQAALWLRRSKICPDWEYNSVMKLYNEEKNSQRIARSYLQDLRPVITPAPRAERSLMIKPYPRKSLFPVKQTLRRNIAGDYAHPYKQALRHWEAQERLRRNYGSPLNQMRRRLAARARRRLRGF